MKCDRTTPKTYWTQFGRRCANAGHSLEWAIEPIKLQTVKDWISDGYRKQLNLKRRRAMKAQS